MPTLEQTAGVEAPGRSEPLPHFNYPLLHVHVGALLPDAP
jgi:hypothetical protein